jgi:Mg-chelatase subunit ChlD/uncharacterized membrane protein
MNIAFIYPQFLWLLLLIPLTVVLGLVGRRGQTPRRLWFGLALRSLLLLFIVLALAGIQIRLPTDLLTTVFLLDVSDSIPPAEQDAGESFIRQAVNEMPAGDRAAVVVFGQDALVERLASEERLLNGLASVPVTTRTNIAGALQLALALFPDEGAKRMVLLSDGRENLSTALDQAELAAAHNIELVYVPLGSEQGEVEVLVEALEAPVDVRQGQNFDLTAVVRSSAQTSATLRVFEDGALIATRELSLQPGINRFPISVEAGEAGFRRFRAQIVPDIDNRLQNNEASAFTVVHGPPRVLIVEGDPGEGTNLASALEAAQMHVDSISPSQFPTTLPEMAAYDAVVLANVPYPALPAEAGIMLQAYVRDLGRGLLMTGGENSFGAGGYLRTPLEETLPVYMDVRNKELSANLALVLAVDKSGSMGRCHCDNPDLNQSYTRAEVGQPKVDIAKEAIMRSASALGPQDYLGVVAFDERAHWVQQISPLVDAYTLEQSIGSFQAEGQTNMRTGVEAAYEALQGVDARRKHIILMTDGWVREGELLELAEQMREDGITLSVVAAGEGSALYLAELSDRGGGAFYPAVDILSVPDFFLKETVRSVGEYIIDEAFYPLPGVSSPILSGLDANALPALFGYNGTSPKNTARLDLLTPRGDPLLASWQYGLGRAAVWTSDLKGQWAVEWLRWEGFSRFAGQLVNWTLPVPQVEGLQAQATIEDGRAAIRLEALDDNDRPMNFLTVTARIIAPDLTTREVELGQVGAGRYETLEDLSQPGTYLVWLGINDGDRPVGQMLLGLVVPYSPEYRASGINQGLLAELARITGAAGSGRIITPEEAFLHNLPAADYAREIWRTLLLAAALLFPLDVAVRRVMVSRHDLQRAWAWVRQRVGARRGAVEGGQPRLMGQLFEARERARQRQGAYEPPAGREDSPPQRVEKEPQAGEPKPAAPAQPPPAPPEGDALARLREAKRRARKN